MTTIELRFSTLRGYHSAFALLHDPASLHGNRIEGESSCRYSPMLSGTSRRILSRYAIPSFIVLLTILFP